jgi:hypothetical protein
MHSESFWSISKITKWLVILSIAIIVIALINTGAFFALNYQTEDAQLQSICNTIIPTQNNRCQFMWDY